MLRSIIVLQNKIVWGVKVERSLTARKQIEKDLL